MEKFQIILGSYEGHCINEKFVFESNKTIEEIRDAYVKSCKLTDLQFDGDSKKTTHGNVIFGGFQDSRMKHEDIKKLKSFGIPEKSFPGVYFQDYEVADLIIEFIRLSLPDWGVKESSAKRSEYVPVLEDNMGYGLYSS